MIPKSFVETSPPRHIQPANSRCAFGQKWNVELHG
jgi:hypothetical protein